MAFAHLACSWVGRPVGLFFSSILFGRLVLPSLVLSPLALYPLASSPWGSWGSRAPPGHFLGPWFLLGLLSPPLGPLGRLLAAKTESSRNLAQTIVSQWLWQDRLSELFLSSTYVDLGLSEVAWATKRLRQRKPAESSRDLIPATLENDHQGNT